MRFCKLLDISFRVLIVSLVVAGLFGTFAAGTTIAETTAASVRLRIGVTTDGLVRITPGDLLAAGLDPTAVDPRTFALSSLGQSVAIRVTGESDGRFDSTDRIEFFGQQFRSTLAGLMDRQGEEKYTDERVYWLDVGGAAGLRVASVDGTPQGTLTPPASFLTTVRAEVSSIWWPLHGLDFDTRDTWFWDRIGPVSSETTRPYSFSTPYPASGSTATLRLEVLPRKLMAGGTVINPTHHVVALIGTTPIADATWASPDPTTGNRIRKVLSGTVPAGKLSGTSTSINVNVKLDASPQDDLYVNYWELDYRRLFQAFNDRIDFKAEAAGATQFLTSGFTTNAVAIWDVTNPARPKRLTGATVSGSSPSYAVRFQAAPAVGARFWMQTEASFAAPASITLRPATGLRAPDGGADTIIVAPDFLRPAAETLATWHRAHGRRTVIADLQDIYDEFNNGIRHPIAVRQMLAWAATNWTAPAPAYLVLMGDGHFNLKNYSVSNSYYKPVERNPIPPYLVFKDPWLGEIPADSLYGDYSGDDLPDVAVGRIPANTIDEANAIIGKIVNYDETVRTQPWQQQIVFAADRLDPAAGNFESLSEEIVSGYLPVDASAQRIYLGSTAYPGYSTAALAKAGLTNAINSGALMVQWTGHAGTQYWSFERVWVAGDVAPLTNGTKLPVVVSFDCLDAFFTYPASFYQSLAETWLRHPTGGAVVVISPTGEGAPPDQQAFRKILMDTMFKNDVRELGSALKVAKQAYAQIAGVNYLIYEMNLFGDPALRLPATGYVPNPPSVSVARSVNSVSLSWPAVTQTTRGTNTIVTNYGIWRSTRPYFDPDAANCNCTKVAETADLSWVDDGSVGPITPIGDVTNNYFYVARAQNSAGWSSNSNRTGEFDFALIPGRQ